MEATGSAWKRWALTAAVFAVALCSSCSVLRPVTDSPAPSQPEENVAVAPNDATPPPVAPAPPEEPAPEPARVVEPLAEGQLEMFLADTPAAEPDGTDPSDAEPDAGEPVTASPLDRLATVEPELDPEELERERDRVAIEPPAIDLPIEINDRVLAWIDLYTDRMKRDFEAGLARSGRHLERFRKIFREAGVPEDLVYMAAVESGYRTSAYSRARARGIFQFMSSTARLYGMRVDYWVDERADPEISARAAAAYMKKLYEEFDDWYLALAAYNAGEGKIRRALRTTGRDDFWGIARTRYIRRETKNHVPAVLAAILISKQPEKYGLVAQPDPPVEYDTIDVQGAADLRVLARCAGTDAATLVELNPALRRMQTPPDGVTSVRVPPGTGDVTLQALEAVPVRERVLYARHRVRRGDTLSTIARANGVTVRSIQQANGMGRRTLIRVNQILKIPTSTSSAAVARAAAGPGAAEGEVIAHRVRRGDTLYALARRYGTTPAAIAAASGISVHSILRVGERLTIVSGVRTVAQARRVAGGGSAGATAGGTKVHTVRRGDTLWGIASLYRTTVATLCALNNISSHSILRPGIQLIVGKE